MRDSIKDVEYFNILIDKIKNSINRQLKKLEKDVIKENRLQSVKKQVSESYLRLLKSKYSRGDDMSSLLVLEIYHKMVLLMNESRNGNRIQMISYVNKGEVIDLKQYTFSGFLEILDVLSLGVLLDVPINDFRIVEDFIYKDEVKDYLLNFLLKFRLNEVVSISEESYHDQNYFHINQRLGTLKAIIFQEDKEIAQKELKRFLEAKWYNSLKGTGYYNQHSNPHNTYSGYWCFVAAAIVKIKGLDDSSFRDNPYYPKDLV
jgi:hypothetical protein